MSSESANHVIIDNKCDNKKIPIAKKQINLPKTLAKYFFVGPSAPASKKKNNQKNK
jgi:hypothetical protein